MCKGTYICCCAHAHTHMKLRPLIFRLVRRRLQVRFPHFFLQKNKKKKTTYNWPYLLWHINAYRNMFCVVRGDVLYSEHYNAHI